MERLVSDIENGPITRSFWSAEQFKAWQKAIGLSGQKASAALGVSDNSITNYRRRGCPKTIALACEALAVEYGVTTPTFNFPWRDQC